MKRKPPPFAICIDNEQYPASLELHKVYQVIPDAAAERDGDLRVIDESGEDYLFPDRWFVVVTLSNEETKALKRSYRRRAG